jgi:hypothetical protein
VQTGDDHFDPAARTDGYSIRAGSMVQVVPKADLPSDFRQDARSLRGFPAGFQVDSTQVDSSRADSPQVDSTQVDSRLAGSPVVLRLELLSQA